MGDERTDGGKMELALRRRRRREREGPHHTHTTHWRRVWVGVVSKHTHRSPAPTPTARYAFFPFVPLFPAASLAQLNRGSMHSLSLFLIHSISQNAFPSSCAGPLTAHLLSLSLQRACMLPLLSQGRGVWATGHRRRRRSGRLTPSQFLRSGPSLLAPSLLAPPRTSSLDHCSRDTIMATPRPPPFRPGLRRQIAFRMPDLFGRGPAQKD